MKFVSFLFSLWFKFKAQCNGWNVSLFVMALLPRLLWAFEPHPPPFSDMEDYYLCAINALRGDFLAMEAERLAYRPPGYPLFLYTVFSLFPAERLFAVRVVQAFLGAFSVLVLFSISTIILQSLFILHNQKNQWLQKVLSYGIALHYAWMIGPVFFSSIFMTETLYTFLLLCWIRLLISPKNENTFYKQMIASVLLGVMALVRPVSLCFLPVLVFHVLLASVRESWNKKLYIPLSVWMIPIIPWTIRNALMLGAFVLLSTNSGVNFYIGHQQNYSYYNTGEKEKIRQELIEEYGHIDEVAEDRYFFLQGLKEIGERPHLLIQHSLQKLYYLYIEDEPPWPLGEYGNGMIPFLYRYLPIQIIMWNPFFSLLALAGIMYAFIKKLPHNTLLTLLILYTAACLIYFARTRFRIPIEPVLIFYAWLGIVSIADTIYTMYWRLQRRWKNHDNKNENPFQQVKLRH